MGRAFIAFLIGAGLVAGVIEIYKRWERSQQSEGEDFDNGYEDDNHLHY